MTFQEFLEKWNGKYCEAGGSANAQNQCVDLANQYIDEVLKLPKILGTDAKDFPLKAGQLYDYIKNTPEGLPVTGDLMIWSSNHISIYIDGNLRTFNSFDQNWPVGTPCHVQAHTYTASVDGWLHPKGNTDYYKEIDLNNKDSIKVCVDIWKDVVDGLYVKKQDYKKLEEEYRTEKGVLEGRITDERKRYNDFLAKLAKEIDSTQDEPAIMEEIARLIKNEDKATELSRQLTTANEAWEESQKGITTRDETIAGLRRDLAALQARKLQDFSRWELLKAIFAMRGGAK